MATTTDWDFSIKLETNQAHFSRPGQATILFWKSFKLIVLWYLIITRSEIAQLLPPTINWRTEGPAGIFSNVRGREISGRSGSCQCHSACCWWRWLPRRAGSRSVLFDTIRSVKIFPGATYSTQFKFFQILPSYKAGQSMGGLRASDNGLLIGVMRIIKTALFCSNWAQSMTYWVKYICIICPTDHQQEM